MITRRLRAPRRDVMITRRLHWWLLCLLGTIEADTGGNLAHGSSNGPPEVPDLEHQPHQHEHEHEHEHEHQQRRVSDSLRHFRPPEVAALSPQQRLALANLVDKVVDKRAVEIVASHFDESLAWLGTHYAPFTTVYTHGDPAAAAASLPGVAVVPLELNAGKENHGFLAHIVQR